MEETIRKLFEEIFSLDRQVQNDAYFGLLDASKEPVDWAYQIWDGLVQALRHPDNHVRAIAAQVLCSLAKSDPEQRMLRDFSALLNVTRDERFVTAHHTMQALWQVGAAGPAQKEILVSGLEGRFPPPCRHIVRGQPAPRPQ